MAKKPAMYAAVLVRVLQGVSMKEQRARVERFKAALKKRGDLRLASSILQEFEKLWEQPEGKTARLVAAAKPSPSFVSSMQKALKKKGYLLKEEENDLLIGGSAVFLGNEYIIDNSVKGRLMKIWRKSLGS